MGMYDSIIDSEGNHWQTKAFSRTLESWSIGEEINGAHPLPFQVEVLGSDINVDGDFVESFATIRETRIAAVPSDRDESLPLLRYDGWWEPMSTEPTTGTHA